MASIATVVTMGYGSFGSVNLLPTLGYGIGVGVVATVGPFWIQKQAAFTPGAIVQDVFAIGVKEQTAFRSGGIIQDAN